MLSRRSGKTSWRRSGKARGLIKSNQFLTCGNVDVHIVYRTPFGGGAGMHYIQCFQSWSAGVPGLKVVILSTTATVKGFLKSAVRDNDPVLFLEHNFLYKRLKGPESEDEQTMPPLKERYPISPQSQ
jgi:pyruvate/2-oxoglutarate/acetoin dehydrogenase E1 component